MAKGSSFGICELCGTRVGKVAMRSHVRKCLQGTAGGSLSQALILRAQAAGTPMFWLDIAAKPAAKLEALDGLLRHVWLECCGHMSEFYEGSRNKVSMGRRLDDVLGSPGDRLGYVYDFGSSTELVVNHADVIDAVAAQGIRVVARNEAPVWPCDECGQPAAKVCVECANMDGGFFCAPHAEKHPCGEEMLLPVVNSPRMGVCGYTGEA